MTTEHLVQAIIQSVLFSVIGVVVFGCSFVAVAKMLPFSVRKEIEEDQNTALGIMLGAVILGLSIIISSAIR
jgi:uncharacterized membrane protein YjfL (UPF0719 family)